jgi:hypothetical protein
LLIAKGACLNILDRYGRTPLDLALSFGYLEIAFLLMEQNADISISEGQGDTLLQVAYDEDWPEVAAYLVDRGVDVNKGYGTTFMYSTALYMACRAMSFQMVQLLIERGADPNTTGVYNRFIL